MRLQRTPVSPGPGCHADVASLTGYCRRRAFHFAGALDVGRACPTVNDPLPERYLYVYRVTR